MSAWPPSSHDALQMHWQDEELVKAKRARLEESLWHMLEADVVDVFETIEVPKLNRKGEPALDKDGHPVT